MELKINKRAALQYCLLLLLLYWHDSGIKFAIGRSTFDAIVLIFCTLQLLMRKSMRSQTSFLFILLMTLNVVFVRLLTGGVGITTIFHYMSAIMICYCTFLLDKERFVERFVKLVIFYSVISIAIWIVIVINKELYQNITLFSYTPFYDKIYYSATNYTLQSVNYHGVLLYVLRREYTRNNGIFNEPGLYSILVSAALYLTIFYQRLVSEDSKKISRYVFILLATIVTMQSTTGLISAVCIILGYLLLNTFERGLKTKIVYVVVTIIAVLGLDYSFNGIDSIIGGVILNKISFSTSGISFIGTGLARASTVEIVINNLLKQPFGIGYNNFYAVLDTYGKESADGTAFFSDIICLGVEWAIILFCFIIKPAYKNRINNTTFFVFIAIYINATTGQSDVLYPSLLMLSLPLNEVLIRRKTSVLSDRGYV